jgi:hypothetical protein
MEEITTMRKSKAKGRRLQNLVRDKLRKVFVETTKIPRLDEDDIKSQTMGMGGEDIVLSPIARKYIPYSIECKNVERVNIWNALKQAESNTKEETKPVLIIKRNNTKPYAVIELNHWIDLIS